MARILLWIILFLLLYGILRYLMKDMFLRRKKLYKETESEELVQDPYCQTYVPKRSAIRKRLYGKDYYFCEEECLKKFIKHGHK